MAEVEGDFKKAESNLQRALTRVGDCETAYREAAGPLRRQLNLAFFRRLLIDDDYNVSGELAEPFDTLLGPELRRAVAVRANEQLQDAVERTIRERATEGVVIENEQHPREPGRLLVGAGSTTGFSSGGGSSTGSLVHLVGQLSNPSAALAAVFEALRDESIKATSHSGPQLDVGRLGNGVVQRAVVRVLASAQHPLTVLEAQVAVVDLLGHPVSKGSINCCLSTGALGEEPASSG